MSKFVYCVSSSDGVLGRHKVYTSSGRMSLHLVLGCCLYYLALKVHSRGLQTSERGIGPKSLVMCCS